MTPPARRNRLKNLTLKELSLVDRPANQHALHVLRKRLEQGKSAVSQLLKSVLGADQGAEQVDDVQQMSDALAVSVADILEKSASAEELEANVDATLAQFRAHLLKAAACDPDEDDDMDEEDGPLTAPPGKKVKKLTPAAEAHSGDSHQEHDMDRNTVLKGLSPDAQAYIAHLEKSAETAITAAQAAEKLAKSAIDRMETQRVREHARELIGKSAAVSLDDAVAMLQGAEVAKAAGDAKAVERIETLLKKQAELIDKSRLFNEDGVDDVAEEGSAANANQQLEKLAQERVEKSAGKVSFAKAYRAVCDENQELYEQAQSE